MLREGAGHSFFFFSISFPSLFLAIESIDRHESLIVVFSSIPKLETSHLFSEYPLIPHQPWLSCKIKIKSSNPTPPQKKQDIQWRKKISVGSLCTEAKAAHTCSSLDGSQETAFGEFAVGEGMALMRTSETRQASGSMEVWIPSFLLGFVKTRRREAAIMEIGYDWFVFFCSCSSFLVGKTRLV